MTDTSISLSPREFFDAESGLIAQVKPDFSPRPGQQELAEIILEATLNSGQHVIAEAGTGFGKSFSALVPAIIEAVTKKKRIVISTETIALQDQYFLKDLPLLQKACKTKGLNFTFAVAKGRGNYVCKAKLDEETFDRSSALMRWGQKQTIELHNGDRASVPFDTTESEWWKIGADEDCERRGCPFYGEGRKGFSDCFVYKASREFAEAQIVVTNHKLFLLDTLSGAGNVLGSYDLAIIDEAHTLPEQAQATWGAEIRPRTVTKALRLIQKILRKSGINHFEAGFLDIYLELEDRMFNPFKPVLNSFSIYLKNIPDRIVEKSKEAASELVEKLILENKMLKEFGESNQNVQDLIDECRDKIFKLIRALKTIYGDSLEDEYKDNWIVFLESKTSHQGERYGVLHLKPIEVAPLIKGNILDSIANVIFMSATLKVEDSFYFMKRELGLSSETMEFTGETPFDYYKQVEAYYPDDLPDPTDDDYAERLAKRIRTIIRRRKGRALVLFTSADLMRKIHALVEDGVEYHCYLQGDASKNVLIERFKQDNSCLFATRSFFTGVDIPGEALSTVVLTKAPFRVPSDPLFKSRCDKIKERGGNDFANYSMPLMLLDVKQAFGRLIRTVDDTGMFCFLDSRATKKAYGMKIRKALPRMRVVDRVEEV